MNLQPQKKLIWVSMLTVILALLLVGLVLWVHLSTQDQVRDLQGKLQDMQKQSMHVDNLSAEVSQMRQHIRLIEEELSKLEEQQQAKTVSPPPIKMITPNTPTHAIEQQPSTKPASKPVAANTWRVVIASFNSLEKAQKAQKTRKFSNIHHTQIIKVTLKHGIWYRIIRADFTDKTSALAFTQKIRHSGFKDAWLQHRP